MKNFLLIFVLLLTKCSLGQNPFFKLNIQKTNAFYYIKQPSYGHYTQNYFLLNGFLDVSLEKRNINKNYIGIGLNLQGRNYTLNYPIIANAGRHELYKSNFNCSFFSYYLKYNIRLDSGKHSNTFASFALYYSKVFQNKNNYFYDSIPNTIYMEQSRDDFIDSRSFSPVIGINNEYRLGNFVYFRSGIEFIPTGSGGRGFKNNSRLSLNIGIQLRIY